MIQLLSSSNKYLASSLVSLSVWVVSILINAIIFAVIFILDNAYMLWERCGFILICSTMFSIPGIIIFWLVLLVRYRNENLFPILLVTAFWTSLLSVLIFFLYPETLIGIGPGLFILLIPVLSALAAVGLHRPAIAMIVATQNNIYRTQKNQTLET